MDSTTALKFSMMELISEKKNNLESLVRVNGLSSPKVLDCSQQLDQLIYQMQLLNLNPSLSGNEENES